LTSKTSTPKATDLPRLALAWHALGGGVFGCALARYLFELVPTRLTFLGGWPGTLGLTLLGALASLGLARLIRTSTSPATTWAPLALLLPVVHIVAPDVHLLRGLTLLAGSAALYALLRWNLKSLFLPLFVALFLLYFDGLAPAVGEADSFEFQVGIARLGIAHGSGYPLLMIVGKLFSLLPLDGTLAWRANLTSAFFGALAAVGVARLARRLGAEPAAAGLAGLAFGLSPTLWSRAVEVEAYTLNAALVAGLLLLSLDLIREPRAYITLQVSHRSHRISRLTLLAFLFGLSLTNHLTTLLLAPALAFAATRLWRSGGAPCRLTDAARPLLAFCVGLAVYLYIPLRWPAVNDGEWMTLAQFANILGGSEARGAFLWDLPWRDLDRWVIAFGKLAGEYGPLALALAALGLAGLVVAGSASTSEPQLPNAQSRSAARSAGPLFTLAYLPYLYFALAFNVPDPDFSAFFIPLHLVAAVLMPQGLKFLTDRAPRPAVHAARCALLSLFALLPLQALWTTLPRVDQSDDWEQQRLGEYILSQPLAQGAAILADSQKIAPLYYLQVAEGARPDLDIIVLPDEAAYRAVLDERIAAGQVVYLARYIPGLGAGYSLRSVGPLAEVSPHTLTTPLVSVVPPSAPLHTGGIRLLGLAPGSAGYLGVEHGKLNVTLMWQAATAPEANLLVSLRLTDEAGAEVWQSAGAVPVSGLYPTNAWRVGEVVSDYHAVPIPAFFAPGSYHLEVGLLPPFASEQTGWTELGQVVVPKPTSEPRSSRLLRAQLGGQWLLGYDAPEAAAHSAQVPITLYWQRGDAETITALGESRSLAGWPPGALAPLRYNLTAPARGAALPIVVSSGATARCGWLAPLTPDCSLPPVTLIGEAAAPGAINFANLLLLRRAELGTALSPPGGSVSVQLEWQGLQTLSEDYTVFVHLIGPDGLVHGQVDAWPVSGTRATTTWLPGDVIPDPYLVPVAADAPPGEYLVEIGLYLLATGERLPVLNVEGIPVEDRFLLAGLTISP
jgi:hypothetical protein